MNNIILYLKISVAAIGAGLTWLFGGWSIALIALLIFIVVDYLTGVIYAVFKKELSSEIGFKGLLKKVIILAVLAVSALLDRLLGLEGYVCRTAVCYFYIANEGISILENAAKLGVPVPDKIKSVLAQIKDMGGGKIE